jgi:6-phosphogluconolactonase
LTEALVVADAEAVAECAARAVEAAIDTALAARGVAHIALAGGTTPKRAYELIEREDWSGVELWFGDERCVPPDDPDSNYRMARETLHAPGAVMHRMEGERGAEQAAAAYAELLRERVAGAVLDLVLLGIGPDGHTASLFPDNPALAPSDALCVPVHDAPKPPPDRVSLTLEVLNAARSCLLLASGSSKAEALAGALGPPTPHVPSSLLARARLTVVADGDAAP